jgi:cell wall-associated NlpC family hydrolase
VSGASGAGGAAEGGGEMRAGRPRAVAVGHGGNPLESWRASSNGFYCSGLIQSSNSWVARDEFKFWPCLSSQQQQRMREAFDSMVSYLL